MHWGWKVPVVGDTTKLGLLPAVCQGHTLGRGGRARAFSVEALLSMYWRKVSKTVILVRGPAAMGPPTLKFPLVPVPSRWS